MSKNNRNKTFVVPKNKTFPCSDQSNSFCWDRRFLCKLSPLRRASSFLSFLFRQNRALAGPPCPAKPWAQYPRPSPGGSPWCWSSRESGQPPPAPAFGARWGGWPGWWMRKGLGKKTLKTLNILQNTTPGKYIRKWNDFKRFSRF